MYKHQQYWKPQCTVPSYVSWYIALRVAGATERCTVEDRTTAVHILLYCTRSSAAGIADKESHISDTHLRWSGFLLIGQWQPANDSDWSFGSVLWICFKCPSSLCSYCLNLAVEVDEEKQQIIILVEVLCTVRSQFIIFSSTIIDRFNCWQICCRLVNLMTPKLSFIGL